MARLVRELGYKTSENDLAERLPPLIDRGLPPLVAEEGQLIGCLTMSITHVLHRPRPVGRISMLVVTEAARGRGVGRALVQVAEAWLAERGCGIIEVTSNVRRERAHAFYQRLGYERTSFRFGKTLSSS
jgi:GNAT superfamily N-acetyltransferase